MNIVVIAWSPFQARTTTLASAVGGAAHYVSGPPFERSTVLVPLRYLVRAMRMWHLLSRRRADTLIVITAPVFAPLVGWLWCSIHRRRLVVDCHPGAIHSRRWHWALPLHHWLFRRAQAVLVHTQDDERLVRKWGAHALFLPDDIARRDQAEPLPPRSHPSLLVAGIFDPDEPLASVLEAAALMPEVEVRLTGDINRVPKALRSAAPGNVAFLGYLPYARFLGEMLVADVVGVFTTDRYVMSRAGQDAVGLGRPLVVSDLPWLRGRFQDAALFCVNEPAAIARTVRRALREQQSLAEKSSLLQVVLRKWREAGLAELRLELQPWPSSLPATLERS